MKRLQLLEIHDQPWCPRFLRDGVTDYLQYAANRWSYYTGIIPAFCYFLDRRESPKIVDLCSGGGGPWKRLYGTLKRLTNDSCRVTLTDRFPNHPAFRLTREETAGIDYCDRPVDMCDIPAELEGFRTMFGAFHHLPPHLARKVLQDAVDNGQGIGIFEYTRRDPECLKTMLAAPLHVLRHTLNIRPFRVSRLVFTYAVPVIPFVVLFDGVVSCLRSYTAAELEGLANSLSGAPYEWETGECPSPGSPFLITYLIGAPKKAKGRTDKQ